MCGSACMRISDCCCGVGLRDSAIWVPARGELFYPAGSGSSNELGTVASSVILKPDATLLLTPADPIHTIANELRPSEAVSRKAGRHFCTGKGRPSDRHSEREAICPASAWRLEGTWKRPVAGHSQATRHKGIEIALRGNACPGRQRHNSR